MSATGEQVRAWRPAVAGIREVFHAHFDEHAYPRHTHDVWTLITVLSGDIHFALDGRDHRSSPAGLTLLPPHVTHDGRAGSSGEFTKAVLYLEASVIGEDLIGHAVDRPTTADPVAAALAARLHARLAGDVEALEGETLVDELAARLRTGLRPTRRRVGRIDPGTTAELAEAARAHLDAHLAQGVALADLAVQLHVSSRHLARAFSTTFGIPPHAYVLGQRIARARDLLLDGWPPAGVAAEVGFVDQAHLSRHFRRHVGTTPGRFARGQRHPAT